MSDAQAFAHHSQLPGIDELNSGRLGVEIDDKIKEKEEGAGENYLTLKGHRSSFQTFGGLIDSFAVPFSS